MNAPNDEADMRITEQAWTEISHHAQDAFPDECCGVIFSDGRCDYAQRLKNMQNTLHALDPLTYPRTAEIAYAMDPLDLDPLDITDAALVRVILPPQLRDPVEAAAPALRRDPLVQSGPRGDSG